MNNKIQQLKKDIIDRGWESIRYVLFNKQSILPFAIHLYEDNNQYFVERRDERGELLGNAYSFLDFYKAKERFLKSLSQEIILNNYYVQNNRDVPYHSSLWGETEKVQNVNQILEDKTEVIDSGEEKKPIKKIPVPPRSSEGKKESIRIRKAGRSSSIFVHKAGRIGIKLQRHRSNGKNPTSIKINASNNYTLEKAHIK